LPRIVEVSVEQIPGMMVDQVPAGFAVWTREEDGDWTLIKGEFRNVDDLGRFLHQLQVDNEHSVRIREHGHKPGMLPLEQLLDGSGALNCSCDIPKRRHK